MELPDSSGVGDWSPVTRIVGGLEGFARVEDGRILISTGGGERDFVAGVNLGPTIPGRFPGEQAIRPEDFRRWFPQMSDLGIQAIRVYTIMPPAFYEELAAFNQENPTRPLLLVHGVWIPEERFYETQNLYDEEVRSGFRDEIERAVAVVHGDAVVEARPGHASGTYTADVSPWLLSWAIGVEWDPISTFESDLENAGVDRFAGDYFVADADATPTESWLAEMLDHLAGLQVERGVTEPLTFVNWPATDPLSHPDEPLDQEDLVGIDANHIRATDAWPGGFYASYHLYPHYPDFQRYEPGIADFLYQGRRDSYAGYLTKVVDHHGDVPVMVTEFGVPSGMGTAHLGPQGRNQGGHPEHRQMEINAELLEVIHGVGMSGGFYFEWTDEWFKLTWNTVEYELPAERRPLWKNAWTNESHFGIIATDPGERPVVVVDGDGDEWETNGSQVLLESQGAVREVRAVKDEGFLYLRMQIDEAESWRTEPIVVGLDLIDGGNGGLPGTDGVAVEADYAVVLGPGEDDGRVMVRASNDPYLIRWAWLNDYEPVVESDLVESSGVWSVQRLVMNRPVTVPTTGESFPPEVLEAGVLVFGTADPADPEFDSRTTWSASGDVIEVRLPYQAIGFSDPSSLQAYRILGDGSIVTETVERVGITVTTGDEVFETAGYAWEPWQTVSWHERLKAGTDTFATTIITTNGG